MPDQRGVERGVRLFEYLVDAANRGEAVGIAHGDFTAFVHGSPDFRTLAGRNFLPSDSGTAIDIAWAVTDAVGGRKPVTRAGCMIPSGMDTYIWNKQRPYDRPPGAWESSRSTVPYSRAEWLRVFPEGTRRLVTEAELRRLR